jgi:hypothetical protein
MEWLYSSVDFARMLLGTTARLAPGTVTRQY